MPNENMSEQHPFFPSGEWEGFYIYGRFNSKDSMATSLNFANGVISGSGNDPIGSFIWDGEYDLKNETCTITKKYIGQHAVYYEGRADENGIWGNWAIRADWGGGFHLWPKKSNSNNEQEKVQEEELVNSMLVETGLPARSFQEHQDRISSQLNLISILQFM